VDLQVRASCAGPSANARPQLTVHRQRSVDIADEVVQLKDTTAGDVEFEHGTPPPSRHYPETGSLGNRSPATDLPSCHPDSELRPGALNSR